MGISTEIKRIKTAKAALKDAINARGGTLSDKQLIDEYAAAVSALPTGEAVELDFVTASASDILAGKVGADANGNAVYGNIQTVTATLMDNVVTVPAGYVATAQTLTVSEVTATLTDNAVNIPKGYIAEDQSLIVAESQAPAVSGNTVTVYKGYQANDISVEVAKATATISANVVTIPAGYHDADTLTVAEAGDVTVSGNSVTIPVGYIASQRTATVGTAKGATTYTPSTADQTISADTYLSGVQTIKGDANLKAENIAEGVSIFGIAGSHSGGSGNSSIDSGTGGSMDFYKCAAVHGPYDVKTVVISGCPVDVANGEYLPTEFTTTSWDGNSYIVYMNYNEAADLLPLPDTEPAQHWYYYYYPEYGTWGLGTSYTSMFTYQGQVGSNFMDQSTYEQVEGMTGAYGSQTVDADVPKTWDGYKVILNNGIYTLENTLTEGLTYSDGKPIIDRFYTADTAVSADYFYDGVSLAARNMEAEGTKSLIKNGTNIYTKYFEGVSAVGYSSDYGLVSVSDDATAAAMRRAGESPSVTPIVYNGKTYYYSNVELKNISSSSEHTYKCDKLADLTSATAETAVIELLEKYLQGNGRFAPFNVTYPADGLVFHADFSAECTHALTGQKLTMTNVTFGTSDGVDCAILNGTDSFMSFSDFRFPSYAMDRTIILKAKGTTDSAYIFLYGGNGGNPFGCYFKEGKFFAWIGNTEFSAEVPNGTDTWHTYKIITRTDSSRAIFIDGVECFSSEMAGYTVNTCLSGAGYIGHSGTRGYSSYLNGCVAFVKVYTTVIEG